jgi:hypothetical protein
MKKVVSWDDVALALPAVVMTKLVATFDALGAAAAVTPASIGAATPASVTAAITALVNAAPGAMDTLGEIAAIIASDESAAAALLASVAAKVASVSAGDSTITMGGTATAPTVKVGTLTKTLVTATGLTYSDVGAEASGVAAGLITTQHTADVIAFDPANAASAAVGTALALGA